MNDEQMRRLAGDLSSALDELPPQKVEIVAVTGEMLTVKALELARLYDSAKNGQRAALDQIARSFRLDPPKRPARRNA